MSDDASGGSTPSPLSAIARVFAGELLKEEVRDRLRRLEREPLGYLLKAGMSRHRVIKDEGRDWTGDDVSAFLDDVPEIVEYARREQREDDGGAV